MTTLYMFRHGQTDYNKDKIFTGWLDPDINENGVKESKEIAAQLKGVVPNKAYTSDLKRAQHTLEIVLEEILGSKRSSVKIFIDPRLKERNYGALNGLSKEKIEKEYPKEYPLWHRSYDVAPPNGESIKDVEKRVLEFLHDVLPTFASTDVIFISAHGNSLRPIRRYFEHMSIDEMCSFEHPRAKVYKYEF
ncbi:MAG: 2,3-bisphosphoglycerate-dependent phosphoglycerate mutase [Candidatus Micrarchaeaceae archaeon]